MEGLVDVGLVDLGMVDLGLVNILVGSVDCWFIIVDCWSIIVYSKCQIVRAKK